ncbi:MAG: glutathione S-transferase family protein [Boseongicola sp.]
MSLIVTGPVRSRTFRVLWLLEELELAYEHRVEMPHSDVVNALNTLRQVPILQDGDAVLTDSLAILHYLSDREARFTYPVATPERAHMDARINFVLTEIEAPLWMRGRHSYVLPEEMRHAEIFPMLDRDIKMAEKKFARLLGDAEYLAGDQFTIADIVAGHVAGWAAGLDLVDKGGPLGTYFERLKTRPAWARGRKE